MAELGLVLAMAKGSLSQVVAQAPAMAKARPVGSAEVRMLAQAGQIAAAASRLPRVVTRARVMAKARQVRAVAVRVAATRAQAGAMKHLVRFPSHSLGRIRRRKRSAQDSLRRVGWLRLTL